ncbi:UDP-glycosyltransferase superfamily protein, partial [Medicago truncatula]
FMHIAKWLLCNSSHELEPSAFSLAPKIIPIGPFFFHCDWRNSTLESVGNEIPMLCWPYFADKFSNRSYICDVWEVGMELEKDGSGVKNRTCFE